MIMEIEVNQMKKQLENIRHDYLRYANCWEDADVLLKGLAIEPGDKVFSIGSGGDNSFSLLTGNPELVVAVDVNPVQLHLIELKKAAFKTLSHEEFLCFLGFAESNERKTLFYRVKTALPKETQQYWENNLNDVIRGIIFRGKFERYFNFFHSYILPLVHNKKRINGLFTKKPENAQKAYFNKAWNSFRWKTLFKLFFSRFVLGRFGRDPKFLREVQIPVSDFILQQAGRHLSSVHCQQNHFLEFILKGRFGTRLPHYARRENFEIIRKNIDKLVVFHGYAEDAFKTYTGFNKFNLSNIFEYMPETLFREVVQCLAEHGVANSRYMYWNLMVPRLMNDADHRLSHLPHESEQMHQQDLCFFYSAIHLSVKNSID